MGRQWEKLAGLKTETVEFGDVSRRVVPENLKVKLFKHAHFGNN